MYRTRYNWNNFSHSFLNLLRTNFICKYDILNIFDQNFIMCFLSCFWLQVYRERRESLVRILQFLRVAVHVKQCGGFRQIWCISGSHFLYWFGLGSEFYFESGSATVKSKPFFCFLLFPFSGMSIVYLFFFFRFKFFIEFSISYTIQDYRSQCYYELINIIIRNKNDDIWFSSTSTKLLFLINLNII